MSLLVLLLLSGSPDGGIAALFDIPPERPQREEFALAPSTEPLRRETSNAELGALARLAAKGPHAPTVDPETDAPEGMQLLGPIAGAPGWRGFFHRDESGEVVVGLWSKDRPLVAWRGAVHLPFGTRFVGFAVPGRPEQFVLCAETDCAQERACFKARALERRRTCVWVAPSCPGSPALVEARFSRIEPRAGGLLAELFALDPQCLSTKGDGVGVVMRGNGLSSWGPDTSIRGTLVTSRCSPPTWGKLVDTQRWSDEASAMVPFVLPPCE